jgi:HD-like signal output (HDOD) protein
MVKVPGSSCSWAAQSNTPWITVSGTAAGRGTGLARFSAGANSGAAARLGTLTIAGQTFTITQTGMGCDFALGSQSASVPASGGSFSFSVATAAGCAWPAQAVPSWINVTTGSAMGAGPLGYMIAANTTLGARTGAISLAGQDVQVLQLGANPTQVFQDVPPAHPFFSYVGLMKDNAITSGCGTTTYCPDASTTHGQMAVFIVRALIGDAFTFPAAPYFTDVPTTHIFFKYVQKMRQLRITAGCGATRQHERLRTDQLLSGGREHAGADVGVYRARAADAVGVGRNAGRLLYAKWPTDNHFPYSDVFLLPTAADKKAGVVMSVLFARPQAPWALRLTPPFPTVAQRVLALVSQEDVSPRQVGELVKMDPSFSAELLRFANSALFGARREVRSIPHAIMLVGMDRVKTMATFVALNRMVRSAVRIEALRKVWLHSLVTAVIAEEASRLSRVARDSAYTAGLLHNLGTLGLMSAYPDEYSRMLEVSNDFGFDLLKTERDLFDIDHCAAGAYLAQDWDFPDELAAAIATHHDEPVPGERSLDNLIKVSWRLADTLGYAAFSPDRQWEYEQLIAYIPHAGSSWLGESAEAAKTELDSRLAATPI